MVVKLFSPFVGGLVESIQMKVLLYGWGRILYTFYYDCDIFRFFDGYFDFYGKFGGGTYRVRWSWCDFFFTGGLL